MVAPGEVFSHLALGLALSVKGEKKKAREAWRQAVKIRPEDRHARMNILASLSKELYAAGAGFKDSAAAQGWWKQFGSLVAEAEEETTSTIAFFDALPENERKAPMVRHLHANALGQYCSVQNILGHKHEMLVAARRVVEIALPGSGERMKHEAAVAQLEKEIRKLLAGDEGGGGIGEGGGGGESDGKGEGGEGGEGGVSVRGDVSAICPAELKVKGEEAAARWRELEGRPPRKVE